jgi:transposase-like protein
MTKAARVHYTLEFKQEAVRLAEGGYAVRMVQATEAMPRTPHRSDEAARCIPVHVANLACCL